jgi:hypothetical protein
VNVRYQELKGGEVSKLVKARLGGMSSLANLKGRLALGASVVNTHINIRLHFR